MHSIFTISKGRENDDENLISDTNENSENKTDEQNGSDGVKDRNSPGGSKAEAEAHTEAKKDQDSSGDEVPIDDLERKDFETEKKLLKNCNNIIRECRKTPNKESRPDDDDGPPGSRTPLFSGIPRFDLPGCSNSNDTIRNMMRRKPLYPVEAPTKKKPAISPDGTPPKKLERPIVRPTFMQRFLSNNVVEAKDIPRGKLYKAETVDCICEGKDTLESSYSLKGRTSSDASSSSDNSKDYSVPSTSNADKLLGLDKRDEPSGKSAMSEEYKYYKDDESDDDSSDVHCCTCLSSHEDEDDEDEEEPGVDERLWRKRRCEPPSPQDLKKFCADGSPAPCEEENYSGSNPGSNFSSPGSSSTMYRLPEVKQWLQKFLSWPDNEKDEALDMLIGRCSVGQVRYMMKSIEPLLQRDFISLLPKELALTVLGYLEPKDLARAARTCRYWRFLADDNLLWKDQCRRIGITTLDKKARKGISSVSPWKAAYMRQYLIENNWLHKPVSNAKVMRGHDDHVITCLQFCGNRILSGSDDTTLKIWSSVTGKCLRTLRGHTGGVWSSQMVGDLVISGSTDRTLRIWNANTGRCLNVLMGHSSTVRCMHLYKKRVVSGSRDTTLRVWSIPGGKCLSVLSGHLAAVRCVQYDGNVVVSGAYDYFVKVWNPDTGECLHTLAGHKNRVYSLQFDGVHAVSGSLDTTICVWDVASGKLKRTLTGHQSLTSGMELQSNILVSGNADSTVKVWNIATGHCLHTLSGPNKHQSAVTCLQTSNRFVITSSDDGTVKLWDIRTGEFLRNLVELGSGGSGGVVWRIRASATKLICAVGSRNGTEETKLLLLNFDVPGVCEKCKK